SRLFAGPYGKRRLGITCLGTSRMAKRYRFLRRLLAATSKLPWRVAVGLAIVSVLAFYLVADLVEVPAVPAGLADSGLTVVRQIIYVIALILAVIAPVGILSGTC